MFTIFKCVAEAIVEKGVRGALVEFVPGGGYVYEVGESAWKKWKEKRKEAEQQEELQELVRANAEVLRAEAKQAIHDALAKTDELVCDDDIARLATWVSGMPEAVRRSLRAADNPKGDTVPASFQITSAGDLVQLLPARPPRFNPGEEVPQAPGWVLEKLLGTGGFGEVWLARNRNLSQLAGAFKFYTGRADATLRHEAAVISRLIANATHPNIVPLIDANLTSDPPWLRYEYVSGGTLTDWIPRLRTLTAGERIEQATKAIRQLAGAAAFFHRLRPPIVHRDLKPANVLIDRVSRRLRVTDFGIGAVTSVEALRSDSLGLSSRGGRLRGHLRGSHTPLYASPQQKRGDDPDPRDDVHALAVIAYQLFTGDLDAGPTPGWGRTLSGLGLSPALIELLIDSASERVAERPADAQHFLDRLKAVGTPAPPSTSPLPPAPANPGPDPPPHAGPGPRPAGGKTAFGSAADSGAGAIDTVLIEADRPLTETEIIAEVRRRKLKERGGVGSHLQSLRRRGCIVSTPAGWVKASPVSPTAARYPQPESAAPRRDTADWDVTIPGSWHRRPIGVPAAGWDKVCDTPARVRTLAAEEYQLTVSTRVADVQLAGFSLLADLPDLTKVSLASCQQVTDLGVRHLARLGHLTALDLSACNRLTDASLAVLPAFHVLAALNLEGCAQLTDDGLAHLLQLPRLCDLNLAFCSRVTDRGAAALSRVSGLTHLNLTGCGELTDAGLRSLSSLSEVRALNLSRCPRLSDAGLAALGRLSRLKTLTLWGCDQLSAGAVDALRQSIAGCRVIR